MATPIGTKRRLSRIPAMIAAAAPPPAESTASAANWAEPANTTTDMTIAATGPITGRPSPSGDDELQQRDAAGVRRPAVAQDAGQLDQLLAILTRHRSARNDAEPRVGAAVGESRHLLQAGRDLTTHARAGQLSGPRRQERRGADVDAGRDRSVQRGVPAARQQARPAAGSEQPVGVRTRRRVQAGAAGKRDVVL